MPEWAWIVVAGLILAILTPPILASIKYIRSAVTAAAAKSLAEALIPFLEEYFDGELSDLQSDIEYIKSELTLNGGTTVKDTVREIQRQVEALFTDR